MIPDNVEEIIMTKEDYDRNVEQLLYDKINAEQEIERLNNIINELKKKITKAIKLLNKYRNRKDTYCLWCMDYGDNAEVIKILGGEVRKD